MEKASASALIQAVSNAFIINDIRSQAEIALIHESRIQLVSAREVGSAPVNPTRRSCFPRVAFHGPRSAVSERGATPTITEPSPGSAMNRLMRTAGDHLNHLSFIPSWNVFADAPSGTLFCATRGDDALPSFLFGGHWRYRGCMNRGGSRFRGFDPRVANFAAERNGFYVFTSLDSR